MKNSILENFPSRLEQRKSIFDQAVSCVLGSKEQEKIIKEEELI
jgi:hypothetical protein